MSKSFFITQLLALVDIDGDFQESDLQIPKARSLLDPRVGHPDSAE